MSGRENSQGRPRRLSLSLLALALLLGVAVFQTTARADTVTLTSGQVVIDSQLRVILVNLSGEGFNINSRVDDFPLSFLGPGRYVSSTAGCGCDGSGRVTFGVIIVSGFAGGGLFDDSTINGSVRLLGNFDAGFNQPPFPIDVSYVGAGVVERTPTRTTFTVTAPVPEPATLLLLGTGLAGAAAGARRRRRGKAI